MLLAFLYFIEFDRRNGGLLSDDDMREVEYALCIAPRRGDMIPGTGGAYKLRVAIAGHGKRSGARVVYFYSPQSLRIYFITVYAKNRQANLTPAEIHDVQSMVRALKGIEG